MIIIGAGYLGRTLATNKKSLEEKGFKIIGFFDSNEKFIGRELSGIKIMEMNNLPLFIKHQHVDIATITISSVYADEVIKKVISYGIKGIWNFSQIEVKTNDDVMIENSWLDDSLMVLGYNLKNKRQSISRNTIRTLSGG
jgi:redox-sensing transcriptional repressor